MSVAAAPSVSVLGHRAFALFWVGRIVSILSFQMLMVAIGWQLYALTGSALDLGLVGLAQFVPMLVLTLLVGHVADRYDHRVILMVCQAGEAIAAAVLALGTAMGWLDPLAIYVVIALVGAARAFEIPTMVAIIPALVPRPLVPAATAWFAIRQPGRPDRRSGAGRLALRRSGRRAVYGTAIGLWCIGAAFIVMMRMERAPRSAEPMSLRSLLGGFQLRAERSRDPRHHRARHVRGVPGRRRRAVPDLRPRHPARPARGAWACCAPRPRSARSRCRSCWRAGR